MERPSPGRRKIWNITMFIISYALNNLVSGIICRYFCLLIKEFSIHFIVRKWRVR